MPAFCSRSARRLADLGFMPRAARDNPCDIYDLHLDTRRPTAFLRGCGTLCSRAMSTVPELLDSAQTSLRRFEQLKEGL